MGLLKEYGYDFVYHFIPLHYLPFVCREKGLLSKPALRDKGYAESHFRGMSKRQDDERGFGGYVHLTLSPTPPILRAKLGAGFPHAGLRIPTSAIEQDHFDLCRFNVAMTRYLRRQGKPGHQVTPENGRYYGGMQIPIARSDRDRKNMLEFARNAGVMLEVLVAGRLPLPESVTVCCYSIEDEQRVSRIVAGTGVGWGTLTTSEYTPNNAYRDAVDEFVAQAMNDPGWKGNGLEFDRL